jgi:hypothetical protein
MVVSDQLLLAAERRSMPLLDAVLSENTLRVAFVTRPLSPWTSNRRYEVRRGFESTRKDVEVPKLVVGRSEAVYASATGLNVVETGAAAPDGANAAIAATASAVTTGRDHCRPRR